MIFPQDIRPCLSAGSYHYEPVRIGEVCLVVIWDDPFRKILEQELEIHDAPLSEQVSEADIMMLVHQVYVAGFGASSLSGHV